MVESQTKPEFKLIQGKFHCSMSFGSVRIVAAPESVPPFAVEARVYEEDTWLIISAKPETCEPAENLIRLMTEIIEVEPEKVGKVLVKNGNPLRFLAIVHDVDQDRTCKEEWVEMALKEVFLKAEKLRLRSISIPLIGTLHGKLEKSRFLVLLSRALMQTTFNLLERVWLITPKGSGFDMLESLKLLLNDNENI